MKVYHVTKKRNYNKIMSQGLVPKIGKLAKMANEPIEAVYLFKDLSCVDDASWFWDEHEDYDGEMVLLEVDIAGLDFEPPTAEHYEVMVFEIIPPDRITFLKNC